jgi:hypothetical protein
MSNELCRHEKAKVVQYAAEICVRLTFVDDALLRERQQVMSASQVATMHIILRLFQVGLYVQYDKRLL